MHFPQMGNEKKVAKEKKIIKPRHVLEVSEWNKISGQIAPPAPEKYFDHPVASYHLTSEH